MLHSMNYFLPMLIAITWGNSGNPHPLDYVKDTTELHSWDEWKQQE